MMHSKNFFFGVMVLLFLSFISPGLYAEDQFTFKVPVELKNIPKQLKNWALYLIVQDSAGKMIGHKHAFFKVNGSYNGDVTVSANVYPSRSPLQARKFKIYLMIVDPKTGKKKFVQNLMKKDQNSQYPLNPTKPFKDRTEGPIKQ